MNCAAYRSAFIVMLLATAGCNSKLDKFPPPQAKLNDSALLRSLDLDDPKPEDAPKIVQLFAEHSQEICYRAGDALARIGEPAIPSLVEAFRKGRPIGMQVYAMHPLRKIGPSSIPALLLAMDDESYERVQIIAALGEILPTSPEVISALVKALGNEKGDPAAFLSALQALESLKQEPEAKAAAPALIALLQHENTKVRFQAAAVLWRADTDAAIRAGVRDRGMRIVEEK